MNNYLDSLNEAQKQAVLQKDGPMIIIAGAGSGKTRVLTYRIAHLMQLGVDAFNILSLTFTNKAAREMKERIAGVVGASEAKNLWMGTFHSVFARILRSEADKLGFPSNFTIYDTQDSVRLISSIIKEMGLDKERYKAKQILNQAQYRSPRYRNLKARGISADSIEISFNTPTEMKIFSWKGEIDTIMTPWDSIKYYKSFLQAGLMSMDPNTGFIKAWVGGIDYRYFNYDHVMQGKRQVHRLLLSPGARRMYSYPDHQIPKTLAIEAASPIR